MTLFSSTAEYALRAVVELARADGGPLTADEIARRTDAPTGYLSKILRRLTRAGLLRAQRGIGGGFALTQPSREIPALSIVAAVDGGVARIESCPLGGCDGPGLCPLHTLLDRAAANLESALASTSIADLIPRQGVDQPRG
ncbi:MAG: Rrf2 family transcriptional regulator [Planctomycetota bacterium]|nr:MAG: Rrf2 family transcriptional regulator [Planctomycetota bacterium]